jgi:hypothetical protein
LFVTERRARLGLRGSDVAFARARAPAGLPGELDLHCLRHSYITHLLDFRYPERFAPVLASITGLNINTATSWTRSTARDWTEYLAARTPHRTR